MAKLTPKQQKFADEYIICGNATQSAIKAGYSKNSAREMGSENLTKPAIKEYIAKRVAGMQSEKIASQKEVLELLTRQARREEDNYTVTRTGEVVTAPTNNTDAIRALELLGKFYGIYTDRVDVNAEGRVVIVDDVGDGD